MIEIPDEPDRPVCAQHGPLKWGYFTGTKQGARWVSFVFDEVGHLEPHVCDDPERPAPRWQPDDVVAERAKKYADEIRVQLGWMAPEEESRG